MVTSDMLTNLQDTISGSPALASELKRAATTPDPQHPQHRILEHFAFTAPGEGVGERPDAHHEFGQRVARHFYAGLDAAL